MMTNAVIAGAGMTSFGRFPDRSLKELAGEAIASALQQTGLSRAHNQAAHMGNAAAGTITGQVCVPGEVVLRSIGLGRIPFINRECLRHRLHGSEPGCGHGDRRPLRRGARRGL